MRMVAIVFDKVDWEDNIKGLGGKGELSRFFTLLVKFSRKMRI